VTGAVYATDPPEPPDDAPELWEDPDLPFGCEPLDLERYAERRDWVMLFNAIMVAVLPEKAE
jgi:hypothetical protein